MGERRWDLLVAGDVNPDILIIDPDPVPVFGQVEKLVREVRLTIGGSSSIMACGAARLGLSVVFCGRVGDDALGRMVLSAIAGRGVDTAPCLVDPMLPTGATVILGRGDDRAILTAMGTIGELAAEDIPDDLSGRVRHIHVGATAVQPRLRAGLPGLFGRAREAGVTTSFDPNWDPDERWDGTDALLASADVSFVNLVEAHRMSGEADPVAAGRVLARRASSGRDRDAGIPTIVVKTGADGAMAVCGDQVVHAAAPSVTVIDTTGAGDSFDAGFIRAMLDGWTLERGLAFAVACGSASTRGIGGVDAQATMEEALALMA